MERLFKYSSKIYSDRKCLGTRTILGELEEKQESGKVFTKLHLGEYTWQTYNDVAAQAESLGKGLRELGLAPKEKVLWRCNPHFCTSPSNPYDIGGALCKHTSWVDDICNWGFQAQPGHRDNLHKSGGGRCPARHHSGITCSGNYLIEFYNFFIADWGKHCDSRGRFAASTFICPSQSFLCHKCGCHSQVVTLDEIIGTADQAQSY